MSLPEAYVGMDGTPVSFDPAEHLPPDAVSEAMGRDAAWMVGHIRALADSPDEPIRILDAGCGVGTLSVFLLSKLLEEQRKGHTEMHAANVQLDLFDISPSCVAAARINMDNVTGQGRGAESLEVNVFEGDWTKTELYQKLQGRSGGRKGGYHVVLFNPPFLAEDSALALDTIRSGYEQTPKSSLYAGKLAIEGYKYAPSLFTLVSKELGAGLVVRYPIIRQEEILSHVRPHDYYDIINDAVLPETGLPDHDGLMAWAFDHNQKCGDRFGYWRSIEYISAAEYPRYQQSYEVYKQEQGSD